jgi:peptidoglycan/xylan/chitin deacetylase (PgdA/CDA1 family)
MTKKELLSRIVYYSGLMKLAARRATHSITVLTYHRIREDQPCTKPHFDEEVFGPTQKTLEWQMRWLKCNRTVLSEGELLQLLENPKQRLSGCVVVTFDDGYRDNFSLAYPVLKAHSIPAIFFVCPRLVEERRLGWWDIIAYLVKRSEREEVEVCGQTLRLGEHKAAAIRRLQSWMKSLPSEQTANLLEKLSEACGVPFPSIEMQSEELMTWEQIAEAAGNGITIGSHTHTHRVLATLDENAQRWELRESKAALERRLGREICTVAYPAGRHGNFTPASMQIARECGYRGAFSFHSGSNRLGSSDLFDIHRISAAESFNPMFMCEVIRPGIFG